MTSDEVPAAPDPPFGAVAAVFDVITVSRQNGLICAVVPVQICTFFQTSIEFRLTCTAQYDDATAKHQGHCVQLAARLDQEAS